jgi:hypothetical protein
VVQLASRTAMPADQTIRPVAPASGCPIRTAVAARLAVPRPPSRLQCLGDQLAAGRRVRWGSPRSSRQARR